MLLSSSSNSGAVVVPFASAPNELVELGHGIRSVLLSTTQRPLHSQSFFQGSRAAGDLDNSIRNDALTMTYSLSGNAQTPSMLRSPRPDDLTLGNEESHAQDYCQR